MTYKHPYDKRTHAEIVLDRAIEYLEDLAQIEDIGDAIEELIEAKVAVMKERGEL